MEMLTSWEMDVTSAADARSALALLAPPESPAPKYSIALIDADMPSIDGFELVRQINARHAGCILHKVMLLTSGDRSGDVARCEQMGLDAWLMKPINQSELFDTLAQVLHCGAGDGADAGTVAAGAEELPPLRVLLAEDSLYNQKLAVALLERKGHRVVVANNGAQAVELARTQPFDLVLMDVQMPEMDGLEATRAIREREAATGASSAAERLPIVAMTAQAMKGDREKCLEAGMDDYLTKPVRAVQLYETVASVMSRSRKEASPAALPEHTRPPEEPPRPPESPTRMTASRAPTNGGHRDLAVALKAVDGDAGLLADIARAFLSESPRLLDEIEGAIAHAEPSVLHRAAHTIKGGLRLFGADSAYELACRLEGLGRAGDVQAAGEPFEILKHAVVELQQDLTVFAGASSGSAPGNAPVESSRSNS
jgi:CheY-like chemotaxis protein